MTEPLTPRYDLDLPPIWRDPKPRFAFHLARIRDFEAVRGVQLGGNTIIELLAIGAAESGLNSFRVGVNAINGTPADHPAFRHVGLGTYQIDSYYLTENANAGHWPPNGDDRVHISTFLGDVHTELLYLWTCPGYVLEQHEEMAKMNFKLWATWKNDKHVDWIQEATIALQEEDNQ